MLRSPSDLTTSLESTSYGRVAFWGHWRLMVHPVQQYNQSSHEFFWNFPKYYLETTPCSIHPSTIKSSSLSLAIVRIRQCIVESHKQWDVHTTKAFIKKCFIDLKQFIGAFLSGLCMTRQLLRGGSRDSISGRLFQHLFAWVAPESTLLSSVACLSNFSPSEGQVSTHSNLQSRPLPSELWNSLWDFSLS